MTSFCQIWALVVGATVASVADADISARTQGENAFGSALMINTVRPPSRPEASQTGHCTEDGAHCVGRETYFPDVCRVIEATADDGDLDPHFFARLLWQESLFEPNAVSPAGAEGIAQFIPGTAKLRGLRDPFNPAEAIRTSAIYLTELARDFGNLGLAAAAYNAGEDRTAQFIANDRGLPLETRRYVSRITGHPALIWRDAPSEELDLALDPVLSFQEACVAMAESRGARALPGPLQPWGVIITSNISQDGAVRHVERLRNRHSPVLADEDVDYSFGRTPGMRRSLHLAQVGRRTRAEADRLCERLRAVGGACLVLRN